jgi:hypothetical protein
MVSIDSPSLTIQVRYYLRNTDSIRRSMSPNDVDAYPQLTPKREQQAPKKKRPKLVSSRGTLLGPLTPELLIATLRVQVAQVYGSYGPLGMRLALPAPVRQQKTLNSEISTGQKPK